MAESKARFTVYWSKHNGTAGSVKKPTRKEAENAKRAMDRDPAFAQAFIVESPNPKWKEKK